VKRDFLAFDATDGTITYTDVDSGGSTTYTVTNVRKTFQVTEGFGEPQVRGYCIDSVGITFPVDNLSITPKLGDTFDYLGNTYEVTSAELKTANTRWNFTGKRAYLEPGWSTTCLIQRATISQNAAGMDIDSWGTLYASAQCYRNPQNVPQEAFDQLGVVGVNDLSKLYLGPTVSGVRVTDRVTLNGLLYTNTRTQNDARIAMLPEIEIQRIA